MLRWLRRLPFACPAGGERTASAFAVQVLRRGPCLRLVPRVGLSAFVTFFCVQSVLWRVVDDFYGTKRIEDASCIFVVPGVRGFERSCA